MKYVVDTNVAIVANGHRTGAKPECRLLAIDFLEEMIAKGRLVVDVAGEVEEEYAKNLSFGQPGVGNRFIQAFLTSAAKRLVRVDIPKKRDGSFVDFPNDSALKTFDKSDRKFVALAKKSQSPVANAVDSDWVDHRLALSKNGIEINFLCSSDKSSWFA